ncbi:resuscitation-promoting factor RpfD [Mycobacterium sp. MFM001]|uniref:transglycosylase family protein n=1 Tax=Mycobacterium sp. MFM001 TaxID=2049453 RepID=UPI000DA46FA2|nr:transglycosylase family protein [Mycobacterium sp. MFM001]GBE65004.1 resuscitation-promoting factor RpfD [Mycobacterium sp. MFM001]
MKAKVRPAAIALAALAIVPFSNLASADTVNWDALAQCESGGNWSADTGNGFYGGLQISQATWEANGGVGSPENASRAQQIQVAQRIYETQGAKAWPGCASPTRRVAPVGSLNHLLTYMFTQLDGIK